MVFIPGGGFQSGGSNEPLYNGTNIASENEVILVTINYRLHVFGFVNFGAIDSNYETTGYNGNLDQIAALEWINENIAEFGGNPENITIFGESAGAVSTMFLSVTPAAKNLFQKAIPQSGHSHTYNEPERSAQLAENFMNLIGTKKIGDLMKKSTDEIKNFYGKLKLIHRNVADEWRYWLQFDKDFFKILRENHEKMFPVQKYNAVDTTNEIYKKWLKNRADTEENFEDFVNQLDWRVGQELAAEYQSNFADSYFYFFSEESEDKNLKSCHAVDLPFTFGVGDHIVPNPDKNLVKIVQASWAAFAATGNPNNEFIPRWEKYSAKNRQTMELNSKGYVCHKDLNTENLNALRYIYES